MAVPQQAVQARAIAGRLDLPGVRRADRAEQVGEDQARLHEAEPAVELELTPVEQVPVQAGQRHVPVPEQAQVRQVVDRQQRPGRGQLGHVLVERAQIHRDQAGLPVVAVDHVGAQVQGPDRSPARRAGRRRSARSCRRNRCPGAVEAVAVEVAGLVDQVDRDPRAGQPGVADLALHHPGTDRDLEGDARVRKLQAGGPGAAVAGQEQDRPVPLVGQRLGQGTGDVRQAARLGEWDRLGGHEDHVHRASASRHHAITALSVEMRRHGGNEPGRGGLPGSAAGPEPRLDPCCASVSARDGGVQDSTCCNAREERLQPARGKSRFCRKAGLQRGIGGERTTPGRPAARGLFLVLRRDSVRVGATDRMPRFDLS